MDTKLSGTGLKRIACVSMFIDHIGASCIEAGLYSHYTAVPQKLVMIDGIMRIIGRLAFPIYCFLLVEGFAHTHSVKKYAMRLLAFAFISEIPFDWAFFKTPLYIGYQNVYWTLFLGLLALHCLDTCIEKEKGLQGILGAVCIAAAAGIMCTDYGALGVALILFFYYVRKMHMQNNTSAQAGWLFYSGARGNCSKLEQMLFYVFYPAHLLVLGAITNLMLS